MGSFFRKPLGVFVATLVVGSALLAVGMTAFGGTSGSAVQSPTPLTRAQFRHAVGRIGWTICLQLKPVVNKKPRNLREATRSMRNLTAIFDRMTTELHGVVPPRSVAASYRRHLRKFDTFDHALHRVDHLAQTHQWRRFVLLVRSRWWKNLGKLFGPTKGKLRCGQAGHTLA